MRTLTQRIGERIRRLRMAQGLTQKALAERADLPQVYMNRIEKGKFVTIKPEQLLFIAQALGTPIDSLFAEVEENSSVA